MSISVLAAMVYLGSFAMLLLAAGFLFGLVTAVVIYFIIRGKKWVPQGFEVQAAATKEEK